MSVPVPAQSPTPPRSGGVPAGYTKVQDLRGFSLAVPRGATRSTDGERTFYITADGVRVGIKFGPVPPGGAMGSMLAADERGPVNNEGYRDNRVTATTHRGLPAAFWEFTWDGFSPIAEGPRHTYDLAWEQDGTLFDVWVSAPVGRAKAAKGIFDTAVDTFAASGH
ncbi:hypothetical protein ACFVGY_11490 [Streptomyces sp. NPDC127106]|uniref:hypothetical protein n=1 Tax=Streptomyces sp. NPDC127106 TaxID=3345360 RepID=UPI00363BEF7C